MSSLAAPLALVAAFFFGLASVLEQRAAMQEPQDQALRPSFFVRLVRKPVWLLGLLSDGAGYAAQAVALGVGRLVTVQPFLVASVVFALPLGARLTRQRIGRREVVGAAAVCVGLAVFRLIATPAGGRADATARAWVVAIAVIGGAAVLLTIAARRRSTGVRATLLGIVAGVILGGVVSALTKATVDRFDDGLVAVVADWHVYLLIGAALTGFLFVQASLQTGALAPALTTETVFETVAGVTAGIALLHEKLDENAWQAILSLGALAVVLTGIVVLSRCRAPARRAA